MEVRNEAALSSKPPQAGTMVAPVRGAAEQSEIVGGLKLDPFRPERAAVDPVIINILVKIMTSKEDAERICNKAIRKRMKREETVSHPR